MKSIAKCKPSEFLKQANRIRKTAEKWLTDTDIMNIRKNMPELEEIKDDLPDEEKEAIDARNHEKISAQLKENFSNIFDSVMETHADETLELLALCCFVEPEDVDKYSVTQYLKAFNELISDKDVLDFFTSLVQLGQRSF